MIYESLYSQLLQLEVIQKTRSIAGFEAHAMSSALLRVCGSDDSLHSPSHQLFMSRTKNVILMQALFSVYIPVQNMKILAIQGSKLRSPACVILLIALFQRAALS